MSRHPQPRGRRGSQKWLQLAVETGCSTLNAPITTRLGIGKADFEWRSPRADDEFAEYRDQAFLDQVGVTLPVRSLSSFWPSRGPQWDGLARSNSGDIIIVEAKAHISEMNSPASAASPVSLEKIRAALQETRGHLAVSADINWSGTYYQYTNRLAHLYLLRTLNRLRAWLVFVHFVGDTDMRGPDSPAEWEDAIAKMHAVLGLATVHKLSPYVIDVFVDVADVESSNR